MTNLFRRFWNYFQRKPVTKIAFVSNEYTSVFVSKTVLRPAYNWIKRQRTVVSPSPVRLFNKYSARPFRLEL